MIKKFQRFEIGVVLSRWPTLLFHQHFPIGTQFSLQIFLSTKLYKISLYWLPFFFKSQNYSFDFFILYNLYVFGTKLQITLWTLLNHFYTILSYYPSKCRINNLPFFFLLFYPSTNYKLRNYFTYYLLMCISLSFFK